MCLAFLFDRQLFNNKHDEGEELFLIVIFKQLKS